MRRTLVVALVLVVLAAGCLPRWRGSSGPRVAAVGDSILRQLEFSGPTHPNARNALTRSLVDQRWRGTVRGENGWRTQWIRALAEEAAKRGARGIVIVAGVNDAAWVQTRPNKKRARRYVRAQIRDTLYDIRRAQCVVWPTVPLHRKVNRQVRLTITAYNRTLRSQAVRRRQLVVPEWAELVAGNRRAWLSSDGLHLSAAGEQAFQELLLAAMHECLGTTPPAPPPEEPAPAVAPSTTAVPAPTTTTVSPTTTGPPVTTVPPGTIAPPPTTPGTTTTAP